MLPHRSILLTTDYADDMRAQVEELWRWSARREVAMEAKSFASDFV